MPTFKDLYEEAKKPSAKDQPDYVYHSIPKEQWDEVLKTGLIQKTRLRTVFHGTHQEARAHEPGGYLLRVKRKGMPGTDQDELTGEHKTKGNITPGRIEVYDPYKGWNKLK